MQEQWKTIPVFTDYQVSNFGRVKRIRSNRGMHFLKIVHWPYHSSRWKTQRCQVTLCQDRKQSTRLVHDLVAYTFIGSRPTGYFINHIDGNGTNNYVKNLEYVTPRQNVLHTIKLNHHAYGVYTRQAKLSARQVSSILKMNRKKQYGTLARLARRFHVDPCTIADIEKRRTWKHLPRPNH